MALEEPMTLTDTLKPDIVTTSPPSYDAGTPNYSNPGNPVKDLLKGADNVRGSVIDLPVIAVAVALLYDKAWVSNSEDRSWGLGDLVFVIVIAWFIKRVGVGQRWEGMF
jgi:hypothetical protein